MGTSFAARLYMRNAWLFAIATIAGCADDGTDTPLTCSFAASTPDGGDLPALFAQRCDVPGSMGMRKWYRLAATLPETLDVVQLELYEQAGPFSGGPITTGTFPVDIDPTTCGVCLRALGDKGGPDEMEYFATGGSVTISSFGPGGAELAVSIGDATFAQIDDRALVENGCTAELAHVELGGVLMDRSMMGGGGTGNGMGACATTIGDVDKVP